MTHILNDLGAVWWSWVVPMFWQVALLALIVWAIDLALSRRGWPQVRYALWLLVLVKLFIPPSFSLPSSILGRLLPARASQVAVVAPEMATTIRADSTPRMEFTRDFVPEASFPPAVTTEPVEPPAPELPALSLQAWGMLASVTVSVLLFGWLVVVACSLRRLARDRSNHIGQPPWLGDVLAECAGKLRLRRAPRLVVMERVRSPAVLGLFRPVLTCPPKPEGRRRMSHILLHELAHIKRGDMFVNAAQTLVHVLFWFHPAVWLAGRRLRHLRELCCDATVSKLLRERTGEYRATLMDAARSMVFGRTGPGLGLLGLFESASRLRQRLQHLERPAWKHPRLRVIASLAAIALMLALIVPMARVAAKARAEEKAGTYTATLANGVTVELVGISYHPSEGKQWWRANGALMDKAPYDRLGSRRSGGCVREFAIQVHNSKYGSANTRWTFRPASEWTEGKHSPGSGFEPRQGLWAIAASLPAGTATCDLRFGLETGPWTTVAEWDAPLGGATGNDYGYFAYTEAYLKNGCLRVTVADDMRQICRRVVAVTTNGERRPNSGGRGSQGEVFSMFTPHWYGLEPGRVAHFLLETRSFEWVEFRNVSLTPGQETEVEVVVQRSGGVEAGTRRQKPKVLKGAAFGPLIERVLNYDELGTSILIDLDTGRLVTPPEFASEQVRMKWVEQNGGDVFAVIVERGVRELACLDMVVVATDPLNWASASPHNVRMALNGLRPGSFPQTWMDARGGFPATFFFKTREGGRGILQMVGFTHDPRGVNIRYKMVERAAEGLDEEPADYADMLAFFPDKTLRMPTEAERKALGKLWPQIPPEQNAAFYLARAAAMLKRRNAPPGSALSFLSNRYGGNVKPMRDWIERNAAALNLMRQGLRHAECQVPVFIYDNTGAPAWNGALLEGLQDLARLCTDAGFLAEVEGKPAQAADWYLRCIQMGAQIRNIPNRFTSDDGLALSLMGWRFLDRLIANVSLSEDELRQVIAGCRRAEVGSEERARIWSNQAAYARAWIRFMGPSAPKRGQYARRPEMEQALETITSENSLRQLLQREAVDELVHRQLKGYENHPRVQIWRSWLRALGVLQVALRETQMRAALAIYQRRTSGKLPDRFEDLVPSILPEVPTDPFSGGPMHYARTPEGWKIWSVGRDNINNGGRSVRGDPDRAFASDLPSNLQVRSGETLDINDLSIRLTGRPD